MPRIVTKDPEAWAEDGEHVVYAWCSAVAMRRKFALVTSGTHGVFTLSTSLVKVETNVSDAVACRIVVRTIVLR